MSNAPPSSGPPSGEDSETALVASLQQLAVVDVDRPDVSIKSSVLRDTVEGIETRTDGSTLYTSAKRFEELGLSDALLQGLYSEMNFERPSGIQATTLPMILTSPYKHLIAQAQNGSGKTCCFVLAMLSRVDVDLKEPQSLCLCPTRELVLQNLSVAKKMGKYTDITYFSTAETLDRYEKCRGQVVFGTHGRLSNWVGRRQFGLNHIKVLVFDEADNMLEQSGFADASFRLVRDTKRQSPQVQVLLFSATFSERVREFAFKLTGQNPNHVFLPKEQLSLDVIKQYRVVVDRLDEKYNVLSSMIFPNCERLGQTIIFVRSRGWARTLHQRLTDEGHTCTSISGEMSFEDRDRVIQEFRDSVTRILISTDVLSRGFDVSDVTLVVNYDVPLEFESWEPAYETYLHRIGRSGRFGRRGCAFNLVCGPRENDIIDKIANYFEREIPSVPKDDEARFIDVLKEAGLTEG